MVFFMNMLTFVIIIAAIVVTALVSAILKAGYDAKNAKSFEDVGAKREMTNTDHPEDEVLNNYFKEYPIKEKK